MMIARMNRYTNQVGLRLTCNYESHSNWITIEIPLINNMIGDNTYDSDDLDTRSDYSRGSWYHIPTPLPSPPRSPPPEQDDVQDEVPELEEEDVEMRK